MELDLRSVATAELAALETSVQRALRAALSEENARWRSPGVLTMTRQVVGERAAAETPANSMIVQASP
jgi:type VI protein secretion system component VasK